VQSMSSVLSTQRIFVTVIICLMITSCSGGTSSNTSGSGGTSSNTSGRCNSPDDRAADGSRCGGRAASVRPGGR
ncbi:MAG: hypothetical protein ACKOQS_03935, partial [Dolichospermum sp.]